LGSFNQISRRRTDANVALDTHVRLCEPASVQLEPVSGTPKRKLKNGEQRLAPETHPSRTRSLEIVLQSFRGAGLNRRNVASSRTRRNRCAETGLVG